MPFASTRDAAKSFVRKIEPLEPSKNPYEKFRDFCEMSFCAYAKLTADADRAEALEKRYMQIVGTYRDKDAVRVYPELLAIAHGAIHAGGDFLGSVAGEMGALSTHIGQFFTPYNVSKMVAQMTLLDAGALIRENGFITVQEPASGAGGMMLAVADVLKEQGFDPTLHMLVSATDISPLCYHMTFLQLTLRGIPASVTHGDTLRMERFSSAWTPPTIAFLEKHGRLFDELSTASEIAAVLETEKATNLFLPEPTTPRSRRTAPASNGEPPTWVDSLAAESQPDVVTQMTDKPEESRDVTEADTGAPPSFVERMKKRRENETLTLDL